MAPFRSFLFPAALLAAVQTSTPHPAPQTQPSVAGTYHVAICKKLPCAVQDTANVVVSGVIAISDTNISFTAFPDTVRFSLLGDGPKVVRNGCSAIAPRRSSPSTLAASGGMELITWTRQAPDRITFDVYATGLTMYQAELRFTGDTFRGTGKSKASGPHVPNYSDDIIVGRKVGPVTHKACADSAVVWLRPKK